MMIGQMTTGLVLGILAVIFAVVIGVVGYLISIYNSLVTLRNRFQNAFSQIDVQLKRRYDLIPNLVETAKAFMGHERETLEAVIQARNQAFSAEQAAARQPGDPASMKQLAQAEGQLGGALSRLMMVAEAYPDLKANQNMLALQEELKSTENKVAFARQGYNDAVTNYNIAIQRFPNNLVAGPFNFREATLFEIENAAEREAVRVQF